MDPEITLLGFVLYIFQIKNLSEVTYIPESCVYILILLEFEDE